MKGGSACILSCTRDVVSREDLRHMSWAGSSGAPQLWRVTGLRRTGLSLLQLLVMSYIYLGS